MIGSNGRRLITLSLVLAAGLSWAQSPPPVITTTTPLPNGVVNQAYSGVQFQATGASPFVWSNLTPLPPGMTLTTGGLLGGTPTAAGGFSIRIRAASSPNNFTDKDFQLTIVAAGAGLQIVTSSPLPAGSVGATYSINITATGGFGTYFWSVVSGAPPSGTSAIQSGNALLISGTPDNSATYTFRVRVTDSQTQVFTEKDFSLTINTSTFQILNSSPLPNGVVGTAYNQNLTATGGSGQYSWQLISGALPPGISEVANGNQLALIGTPTTVGVYTFRIGVTDFQNESSIQKDFTLSVVGGLSIIETNVPFGVVGTAYSFQLNGQGGTAPFTWSSTLSSALGLSINASTGLISGTPAVNGTFAFSVTIRDAQNNTFTRNYQLFVATQLSILNTSLVNGSQGVAYDQLLQAGGGQAPYVWSLPSGTLPPGLTLNQSTGRITGVPTLDGRFLFTVSVVDNGQRSASKDLSINIGQALTITTTSPLPDAAVNQSYSQTVSATGGQGSYTWRVQSGSLPAGLALDGATGVISGTPTQTGSSGFTLMVTDSQQQTAQQVFTLNVTSTPLSILTVVGVDGVTGSAFTQTFSATGGTQPYTWTVLAGTPPPGLTLNASSGVLSGTPTTSGSFTFTLQVRDSQQGTASRNFVIGITDPLSITTTELTGNAGTAFSGSLAATGGTSPYTWDIPSGNLPAGLTLNSSTGAITGTPTASGTFTVTFRVTDRRSLTATKAVQIRIALPVLPTVTVGVGAQAQPQVSVVLSAPFPTDLSGTLTLTFSSTVGNDRSVRFSNGQTSAPFTIPAGQTAAVFTPPNLAVIPGTVAGTVTLTSRFTAAGQDVTPTPAPTQRITTATAVPVITSVLLQQATGGVNVIVTGYSNTRQVQSGLFRFAGATGSSIAQSDITVQLTGAFATWYSDPNSELVGSQFTLTMPFTVSGDPRQITAVTVTLTNSVGNSTAVSAQ